MFVRSQTTLWTELDDQLMLMNIESGSYYQIEGIGGAIWQMLETPRSETEIVAAIMATYRVDEAQCIKDIRAFLAKLLDAQAVIKQPDSLDAKIKLAE